MKDLVAVLTGVGGHFQNGWRAQAYGYVISLVALPMTVFALQILVSAYSGSEGPSPLFFSGIFLLVLAGLWMGSSIHAIRDRRLGRFGKASVRTTEIALVVAIVYGAVLYGIATLVVAPYLKSGDPVYFGSGSNSVGRSSGVRLLPGGSGDVLLQGTVLLNEKGLPNAEVVLIFQDGYRSPGIVTNALGAFSYRLPSGEWRFAGAFVVGHEARSTYATLRPDMLKPVFKVQTGPVRTEIGIKIVVER